MARRLETNDEQVKQAIKSQLADANTVKSIVDQTVTAVRGHFDKNSLLSREFDIVKALVEEHQVLLQLHHDQLATLTGAAGACPLRCDFGRQGAVSTAAQGAANESATNAVNGGLLGSVGATASCHPETSLGRAGVAGSVASALYNSTMAGPTQASSGIFPPMGGAASHSPPPGMGCQTNDPMQNPLNDAWANYNAGMPRVPHGMPMNMGCRGYPMGPYNPGCYLDGQSGGYGPMMGGRASGQQHNLFSDKVALTRDVQYDGAKGGPAWKITTANFFISKAPDIEQILIFIESQEDMPADVLSLSSIFQGVMVHASTQPEMKRSNTTVSTT